MPNRVVRDGILLSKRVNDLSMGAELFFHRVISVVDDYGRTEADPTLLRVAVFPRRLNEVTEPQIKLWLQECTAGDRPLITLYAVDGETYLQINNFNQRLRQVKSRCPDPVSEPPATGQPYDRHTSDDGRSDDGQLTTSRAAGIESNRIESNRERAPKALASLSTVSVFVEPPEEARAVATPARFGSRKYPEKTKPARNGGDRSPPWHDPIAEIPPGQIE